MQLPGACFTQTGMRCRDTNPVATSLRNFSRLNFARQRARRVDNGDAPLVNWLRRWHKQLQWDQLSLDRCSHRSCNGDDDATGVAQLFVQYLAVEGLTLVATSAAASTPTKRSHPNNDAAEAAAASLVELSQSPPKRPRAFQNEDEEQVAGTILANIRAFFNGPLRTQGTRPVALQAKADVLSEAIFSQTLVDGRHLSSVERLTGMNREQFKRGGQHRADNAERPRGEQHAARERAVRADAVDLDWIWEWFHTASPDVEPDKSVKWSYKRKRAHIAGKLRSLTCEMRIRQVVMSAEVTAHTRAVTKRVQRVRATRGPKGLPR